MSGRKDLDRICRQMSTGSRKVKQMSENGLVEDNEE